MLQGQDLDRVKRICYLSPMPAAKVQASLRICAVSPEPPLLAHTSSESRGTFRQKARSQAPLNGWACAVKICHDGMLEDTNSLDGAHLAVYILFYYIQQYQDNARVIINELYKEAPFWFGKNLASNGISKPQPYGPKTRKLSTLPHCCCISKRVKVPIVVIILKTEHSINASQRYRQNSKL